METKIDKWEELTDKVESIAYKVTEDFGQALSVNDENLDRLYQIKKELLTAWEHMCYMLTYERESL